MAAEGVGAFHSLRSGPVSSLPRFMECIEDAIPVRFVHDNSFNSAVYRRMAKLLLPLGDDGLHVDRILVGLDPLPANGNDRAEAQVA